jgi:NADH-quinone oxidoreductase subunit L
MSHEIEHHIHEVPHSMAVPLLVLALFSLSAGWLSWPPSLGGSARFERFLDPVFAKEAQVFQEEGKAGQLAAGEREAEHTSPTEYLLMFLSVAAAAVGWGMARRAYNNADQGFTEPIAAAAPPVYNVLLNKYYVDQGYDYVFSGRRKLGRVRLGVLGLGEASAWFDTNVVDGAVNAAGWITRFSGRVSGWIDWIIDTFGVNGPAILSRVLSYPARLFEWGLVQWYALVMTAGLVGFVFYYVYH